MLNVSATFNVEVENPAAYDLVINTAHVPLEEAVELVAARIHAHVRASVAA